MFPKTLLPATQAALAVLGKSNILKTAYLAGGSALALHLGHRRSHDLDFYTRDSLQAEDIAVQLGKIGRFNTTLLEPPHTILGVFNTVKFSLFRYDYPLVDKSSVYQDVTLAGIGDIAAMKLSAITGRATKRDYVDLYILNKKFSVEEMLTWYRKKYGELGNNLYVIIKALGYFADAESDQFPEMLVSVSWDEVKKTFTGESLRLAKKYLEPDGD